MTTDRTALALVIAAFVVFLAFVVGEYHGFTEGIHLHYMGPGQVAMWQHQLDGYHACLMWKEKAERIPDLKRGLPDDCRTVHPSCDLFGTDCPPSS